VYVRIISTRQVCGTWPTALFLSLKRGEGEARRMNGGEGTHLVNDLLDGGVHDDMCLGGLDVLLEVEEVELELCELLRRRRDAYAATSAPSTAWPRPQGPVFESPSWPAPRVPTSASNHGLTPVPTSSYEVSSPPRQLRTRTYVKSGTVGPSTGVRFTRATVMTCVGEYVRCDARWYMCVGDESSAARCSSQYIVLMCIDAGGAHRRGHV
jgi:hypothetical protein